MAPTREARIPFDRPPAVRDGDTRPWPPAHRSPHCAAKTQTGRFCFGRPRAAARLGHKSRASTARAWPCCGAHVILAEGGRARRGRPSLSPGPPRLPPETAPARGRPVGWAASRQARPTDTDRDAAPCARGPTAAGAIPVTPRGATRGVVDGRWLALGATHEAHVRADLHGRRPPRRQQSWELAGENLGNGIAFAHRTQTVGLGFPFHTVSLRNIGLH